MTAMITVNLTNLTPTVRIPPRKVGSIIQTARGWDQVQPDGSTLPWKPENRR